MKTITIVYSLDEEKNPKDYQVIKPSDDFNGDVRGLVESITNSNFSIGIKNYLYHTVNG